MSRTKKDTPRSKSSQSILAYMTKSFRQVMTRKRRRVLDKQTQEALETGETNVDKPERVANAKWEWL